MLVARKIVTEFQQSPFDTDDLAKSLDVWATRKPRAKSKGVGDKPMRKAADEAEHFMRTGEWDAARPIHFVALYAHLHESVYGAAPVELGPTERLHACGAAKRMLEKHFDHQSAEMAAFMRWAWTREKGREQWRRDNDRSGGRIGWSLMFNGALLTDFRIDLARTRLRK